MQIGGSVKLIHLVRPLEARRSVSFSVNTWLAGAQVWFLCHVFNMNSDVTSGVVNLGVQNLLSMISAASTVARGSSIGPDAHGSTRKETMGPRFRL